MHRASRLGATALRRYIATLLALTIVAATVSAAAQAPVYPALPGDLAFDAIPDTAPLRAQLADTLTGPAQKALSFKGLVSTVSGVKARASTRLLSGYLYSMISIARGSTYPEYSQGSWILRRDAKSGKILQAKVFLRSDPGWYAALSPRGKDRSSLELVVYGAAIARDVNIGLPIERLALKSLSEIVALTKLSAPWELLIGEGASSNASAYGEEIALIDRIRAQLPLMDFEDDGAMEADGSLVLISSGRSQGRTWGLNCSGFAKWLIDGFYYAQSGTLMSLSQLRVAHPELRKTGDTERAKDEPGFGIDWIRNLALGLDEAIYKRKSEAKRWDVEDSSFSILTSWKNPYGDTSLIVNYPGFNSDSGYRIDGLRSLLAVLAVKDPGAFYLASISELSNNPSGRHHFHVAALFPYFAPTGEFKIVVFESAAETSFDAFEARFLAYPATQGVSAFLVSFCADHPFREPPLPGLESHLR